MKKKIKLLITFLFILLFILLIIIFNVINSFFNKKNNLFYNNDYVSNIIVKDNDLDIIKNNLEFSTFLNLIISKKNLNEINNNDILYYLIKLTETQSQFGKIDNVDVNIINDIYKESILKNIKVNYKDIIIDNKLLWVYNTKRNIYIKNNIDYNFNIIPFIIKLEKVIKEGNKYMLTYKYIFLNNNDNNLYGNYSDCLNMKNLIYKNDSNNNEVLKQQLNNNYNNIKDKLDTYNYIVEVNNNNYTLIDFYIDKK